PPRVWHRHGGRAHRSCHRRYFCGLLLGLVWPQTRFALFDLELRHLHAGDRFYAQYHRDGAHALSDGPWSWRGHAEFEHAAFRIPAGAIQSLLACHDVYRLQLWIGTDRLRRGLPYSVVRLAVRALFRRGGSPLSLRDLARAPSRIGALHGGSQ